MRSDKYIEEDLRKEKLKDRLTAGFVAAALMIVPASIVYKMEEAKVETIAMFYETLLEESNQASYYQGYFDGLFGIENRYFEYTDSKGEGLVSMIKEEPVKKLVLTKKNINE